MQTPRVLLITDAAYPDETVLRVIEAAGRALPTGSFAVQLRDKARAGRADWARRVREATRAVGVAMVVNGDVKLARDVAADGVHFGGDVMVEEVTGMWRSMAAHRDEDVIVARERGVDAVLVSPIFETPGKGAARGVAALERAATLAEGKLGVIALGGVGVPEAAACFAAGAVGVAVIRALLGAEEPGKIAVRLHAAE
jgi:thiamine-phosphate pyrophosphorylase